MKITKSEFDKLYDANITHREYVEIIEKISERFSQIMTELKIMEKIKGYEEYRMSTEDGLFNPKLYKDKICYYNDNYAGFAQPYNDYIPTRWLWEDFKEEYRTETTKIENERIQAKAAEIEKLNKELQQNRIFLASIKSKLNQEEIDFIHKYIPHGLKI
jgi:hypothetical protein